MSDALVFDVEEFSTNDGPGMRTTVFLKGCPLRCVWCHNPEGQRFENEIVRREAGCLHCGACVRAGGGKLSEASISVCPNALLRPSAVRYDPEGLVRRLSGILPMLSAAGGGVTFSGGEPLAHAGFLTDCLRLLAGKTHRAVQTSGYGKADDFDRVLQNADFFLYDLKIMDPAAHARYCGADNAPILRNYRALCESGVPFVTRVPLIPTLTDTEKNLSAIAGFMARSGARCAELLPYNKFAGGKYASVGRTYAPPFDESAEPCAREEIFRSFGVEPRLL